MANVDPKSITIKGLRDGQSVTLPQAGSWAEALTALEARLTESDVRRARDLLVRHDVTL